MKQDYCKNGAVKRKVNVSTYPAVMQQRFYDSV